MVIMDLNKGEICFRCEFCKCCYDDYEGAADCEENCSNLKLKKGVRC